MRYDVDHKERTRLRLLTEASILLREAGPDGLSVATLMKRQGLTHGGFYAHFDSKDDLIEQAIDTMFERTCERFVTRTRGLAPQQGLLEYIAYYLSPGHYNRPGQGCPIPATAGDVSRLGADARKRFEAGVGRLQKLIAMQFEMLGFSAVEALGQAVALLSEMSGAVIMARAVKSAAAQKHICHNAQLAIFKRLSQSFPQFGADMSGDYLVAFFRQAEAAELRAKTLDGEGEGLRLEP